MLPEGKGWGIKRVSSHFHLSIYGYDRGDGKTPVIIPEQAAIVRKIFHMYLEGNSIGGIRKWLNDNNIETTRGIGEWNKSTVSGILRNEKYKGDALLQKSYTVDYLTKTIAKNKGEVTQYYIENNHEGIVSREIFDMVQDELQRRASLYSSKNPSRYSSKYAISGKVICGECGAKYRRVTWARNGKKKIVWRCTERLANGTKNCKNSPTILEENLHNVVLNNIDSTFGNFDDVKNKVKEKIEIDILDNEHNPQTIKRNILKYEKELKLLEKIIKESKDMEFYENKIRTLKSQVGELNSKLKNARSPDSTTMKNIDEFIDGTDLNMNEYFNQMSGMIIESVTVVSQEKLNIKYVDGTEVEVNI